MADTKRVSKRNHTSVRLKRTEPGKQPLPGALPLKTAKRRRNVRTGRVDSVITAINAPGFDLDAAFSIALRKMIERELD